MSELLKIEEAIERRKVITFTYDDEIEIVYPYAIAEKEDGGLILIGMPAGAKKLYPYDVDRVFQCRKILSTFLSQPNWEELLSSDIPIKKLKKVSC